VQWTTTSLVLSTIKETSALQTRPRASPGGDGNGNGAGGRS